MLIDNKLDRSFGKVAFMPGILIALLGCLTIIQIWPAILIPVGLFISFTHSGAQINIKKRQVRLYQNLFGFYKSGKWKSLDLFNGLTIIPVKRYLKFWSMSNWFTSVEEPDFRIFLINRMKKPDFPIKRCCTLEDAQHRIDELSLWLKLPVFTIKKNKELD